MFSRALIYAALLVRKSTEEFQNGSVGYKEKINLAVCFHLRGLGSSLHPKESCRGALFEGSGEL